MKITVNEALALRNRLVDRKRDLSSTLGHCSILDTNEYGTGETYRKTTRTPEFDVEELDHAISDIEMALYKIDRAIKSSNATSEIDFEYDVEILLRRIPKRKPEAVVTSKG